MTSMKSVFLFLCCVASITFATQHQLTINAVYPDSNLAPGATLTLRGNTSGLTWDEGVGTKHSAANTYTLTLTYSDADVGSALAFKHLVDDHLWKIGANDVVVLPSSTSASVTVYPWFQNTEGRYSYIRNVVSKTLNNVRDIVIYTPPSFDENPFKTYPMLIAGDGQNLFNVSTSAFGVAWECQDTLNALIVQGQMEEIVMVGIDNAGAQRTYEYTWVKDPTVGDGGGADIYLTWVEKEVIPMLLASPYRIKDTKRFDMLGSSLGGLLSCYAVWTRPETWYRAGCMSSSFWWDSSAFNNTILTKTPVPKQPTMIYLDSGNAGPDDDDEVQTIYVRQHLESFGFQLGSDLFYYLDNGGQHNEAYWGRRFHVPMTDLYPPQLLEPSS